MEGLDLLKFEFLVRFVDFGELSIKVRFVVLFFRKFWLVYFMLEVEFM